MIFCITSGIESQNDKSDLTSLGECLHFISFLSIVRIKRILLFLLFDCYHAIFKMEFISPSKFIKIKEYDFVEKKFAVFQYATVNEYGKASIKEQFLCFTKSIRLDCSVRWHPKRLLFELNQLNIISVFFIIEEISR